MESSPSPDLDAPVESAAEPGADRIPRDLIMLGIAITLGVVLSTLDTTIVSVGLDTMGRQLHTSISTIQWVTTSYLLAFSMVIPVCGWTLERFGTRRTWMVSLTVFLIGSALCGVSWSIGSLIAFRALQGLGGGMLLPLSQTILAKAAGPRLLGRFMGMAAVPGMLSPAFGPVLGGLIVDHLHWSWLFFVNLPFGAVALVLAMRLLPRDERGARKPLDVVSLLLLSPGLALFTLACVDEGSATSGVSATVIVLFVVSVAMLVAFTVHSLRRRKPPLVDLRLFRHRSLTASSVTAALLGASLFGSLFLFPLYYQQVRGQSAMVAGLLLAPQGIGAVLVTPRAGRLTDRYGPGRVVLTGMALVLLGTLPYVFVTEHTPELWLGAVLVVRGVGLGMTFMPTLVAAYHGIERDQIQGATAIINIAQRIGGSCGTALLSVVLERTFLREAGPHANLGSVLPGTVEAHHLTDAFGAAFWWTLGFAALALLPALFLPRRAAADARR